MLSFTRCKTTTVPLVILRQAQAVGRRRSGSRYVRALGPSEGVPCKERPGCRRETRFRARASAARGQEYSPGDLCASVIAEHESPQGGFHGPLQLSAFLRCGSYDPDGDGSRFAASMPIVPDCAYAQESRRPSLHSGALTLSGLRHFEQTVAR